MHMLIVRLTFIVIFTALFSDYSGINDGLTRIGFSLIFMQDIGAKYDDCQVFKWFNIYDII